MPRKKNKINQGYTGINEVKLIRGGKEYFDTLVQLIDNAAGSIHIQTYIFNADETGALIAEALKRARERNVEVYLLADGYASQDLSNTFINNLTRAGINFRFFEPLLKSKNFYFGRRLHHKVIVIDMKFALVGGMNIANKYNDLPNQPAWLDFALLAEGEIVKELCILCWKTWKSYPMNMGLTPCEEQTVSFSIPAENRSRVRMRRNDWVRGKNEITSSYIQMFRTAESQITVLCSYFLPGKIIRKHIRYALNRGVQIRIITAGISDVPLAKSAERWLYDWLLRNKIELYEYQKSVLHGKLAFFDNQWMTIGSYNVNDISAFASIELNLDVKNPDFVLEARKTIDEIVKNDCVRISQESLARTKNIFKQFLRWCSYIFIRITFHLLTFYFKRGN